MRRKTEQLQADLTGATKQFNDLLDRNSKLKVTRKQNAKEKRCFSRSSKLFLKGLLTERDDENLKLKNEMNILRDQIPGPGVGEEDLIMRAVEERVKKWKVKLFSIRHESSVEI